MGIIDDQKWRSLPLCRWQAVRHRVVEPKYAPALGMEVARRLASADRLTRPGDTGNSR